METTVNPLDLFNKATAGEVISEGSEAQTVPPPPSQFDSFSISAKPLEGMPQPPAQGGTNPPPYTSKLNELIDGKFAADLADLIACTVFSLSFEYLYAVKIPRSEFALNGEEKKTLAPILHEIIRRMNIDMSNPYVALAVAGTSIYGAKVAVVMSNNSELIAEGKEAKEQDLPPVKKNKGGRPKGSGNKPKA